MTMRERLIDILKNKPYGYSSYEDFADHLLANGVIVPPCKVGDTVWLKSLNRQHTEWGIIEGKISMIQQKVDKSWKFRVTKNRSVQDYTVDSIGKTIFLTREEAEKALKESEKQ